MANHPNRSKVTDWPTYVKQFRGRHELSQVDLADKLRVEETTVQRWEAGERNPAPYLKRAFITLVVALYVLRGSWAGSFSLWAQPVNRIERHCQVRTLRARHRGGGG